MNRRSFFKSMIGGVAATAAVRTWPFRVFSFPSEVTVVPPTVRFIRFFDPTQSRMVNRFDVLYGFANLTDANIVGYEDITLMPLKGMSRLDAHEYARKSWHEMVKQYPGEPSTFGIIKRGDPNAFKAARVIPFTPEEIDGKELF